jgi:hypothetical protein
MEQLAPSERIIMKFYIWVFFEKFEKIQVLLKSDKNNRYSHEDQYTFLIIYRLVYFQNVIFQKNVVDKTKTHILYSIRFLFRKSFRLWDNVVK